MSDHILLCPCKDKIAALKNSRIYPYDIERALSSNLSNINLLPRELSNLNQRATELTEDIRSFA